MKQEKRANMYNQVMQFKKTLSRTPLLSSERSLIFMELSRVSGGEADASDLCNRRFIQVLFIQPHHSLLLTVITHTHMHAGQMKGAIIAAAWKPDSPEDPC